MFTTRHKVVHNSGSTNFRRLSFDKKTNYLAQILQSLSFKVCSIILPKFNTFGLFIPILGTSAIMDKTACCHRVTTSETGLYLSYKVCSIILPKFNTFGLFIPILGTSAIMDKTAYCHRVTTSETGLYFSYKVCSIILPKFNTFGLFIPNSGYFRHYGPDSLLPLIDDIRNRSILQLQGVLYHTTKIQYIWIVYSNSGYIHHYGPDSLLL